MRYVAALYAEDGSFAGYLEYYDPDAHADDETFPTGEVRTTYDASEAIVFESAAQVLETWRTQSKFTPYRPDGKPNRPLTGFSVSAVKLSSE